MKTPEQMAEEHADNIWNGFTDREYENYKLAFLAGYKAAKDEDNAKMQELKANWKFCCEDKARALKELAVAERARDQLADVSKVMCNTTMEEIKAADTGELMPITNLPTPAKWISVKDRLPEENTPVLVYNSYDLIFTTSYTDWEQWGYHMVLYWMELPAPPKEEE